MTAVADVEVTDFSLTSNLSHEPEPAYDGRVYGQHDGGRRRGVAGREHGGSEATGKDEGEEWLVGCRGAQSVPLCLSTQEMQKSKELAQHGGYAFNAQQALPTQFSFT